jgi:uncharacterized protein with HEPN domain
MPHLGDSTKLRHMLDASEKAVSFAAGRTRADLDTDELLALALVRLIEVLGAAAARVAEPFQKSHPELPWQAMRGARNGLIHGYFDVDYDVVWQIVSTDLPDLIPKLRVLVPR